MDANREPGPSPRAERFLRAILPAGIVLLASWAVMVVAALVIGGPVFSLSLGTAILGLVTSVCLIVSGSFYRRDLDRRARERSEPRARAG